MSRESDLQRVLDGGVVAIIRADSGEQLVGVAEALYEGGIEVIEVTFTVPGVLEIISAVRDSLGEKILLGAGTVLDAESARSAMLAGAEFIVCPTVNSFKRIGVGPPDSGATWAPSHVAYGGNNRSQMIRVPEGGRFEVRIPDGSANPYLALAAMLGSGLDGIANGVDPGDPNTDNLFTLPLEEIRRRGITALPPTLLHAMDALVADDTLRATLGTGRDGDYVDYFAEVKRAEFRAINDQVSPAEIEAYLTLM